MGLLGSQPAQLWFQRWDEIKNKLDKIMCKEEVAREEKMKVIDQLLSRSWLGQMAAQHGQKQLKNWGLQEE